MEKVTIHRALSELKLIGAKIDKQIQELEPSGIVQKARLVNGTTDLADFERTAKSKYQAVTDLIERRAKIKAAIVKANGETKVTVAGVEMTIADAITQKTTIEQKIALANQLKRKHATAKAQLEKNNAQVDTNALGIAQVALGKQGIKINDEDVKKVTSDYLDTNRFSLVDPLLVDKEVPALENTINNFQAEVDAVLSEANAITMIEF